MKSRLLTDEIEVALCPNPTLHANQARMRTQLGQQCRLPQQPGSNEWVMGVQRGVLQCVLWTR
jgi:hypothetical protein